MVRVLRRIHNHKPATKFKMTIDLEALIRDLSGTGARSPGLHPDTGIISELRLIRVGGIAKVKENLNTRVSPVEMRQRSFYSGLFGSGQSFIFVIRGQVTPSEELQVFVALPAEFDLASGWGGALHAVFPGCETSNGPEMNGFMSELKTFYPWVATLSGNPSISFSPSSPATPEVSTGALRLEDLLSCMSGTEWAYVLQAKPVFRTVIEEGICWLAEAERTVVGTYLKKGTSEEENNPIARQAVDLIKAYTKKYIEGRSEGMWDVNAYLLAKTKPIIERAIYGACSVFAGPLSSPQPFRVHLCGTEAPVSTSVLKKPPFLLTTSEVATLAHLSDREFPGYRIKDRVRFAIAPPEQLPIVTDKKSLHIGTIVDEGRNTGVWYKLGIDSLCKHAFVAGVPGQGKTRTCFYLLHQLWEQSGIPWLVLEPSTKSEYRQLLASDTFKHVLRVFTCGHEGIAPIRINPLEVLPGIHVQTQIDMLQTLLNSAFAWVTPMPTVLNKALHRVYRDRGWDLAYGTNPEGYIPAVQPNLDDLIVTVGRLCGELGYSEEVTGNIRAGLQTRLSSLTEGGKGLMLNCRESMSMKDLLDQPTVLELAAIGDDDEKAFILGVILVKLAQFRQSEGLSRKGLRHVTVVEEAHRLLRAVPATIGTDTANSRGKLVEAFCNILAEFRAYGEGIVVVDQIPEKLAPEVVKNTNLKIIHRLVSRGDRELVGGAMNLSKDQEGFIATLQPGQAVVYSETREYPYHVQVPNHAEHRPYKNAELSNSQIYNHMLETCNLMPAYTSSFDRKTTDSCACTCGCAKCSPDIQNRVLSFLLANDRVADFSKAVSREWTGMWDFGIGIAREAGYMGGESVEAAFCALMQIGGLGGYPADVVVKMKTNLGVLRDAALEKEHLKERETPLSSSTS